MAVPEALRRDDGLIPTVAPAEPGGFGSNVLRWSQNNQPPKLLSCQVQSFSGMMSCRHGIVPSFLQQNLHFVLIEELLNLFHFIIAQDIQKLQGFCKIFPCNKAQKTRPPNPVILRSHFVILLHV